MALRLPHSSRAEGGDTQRAAGKEARRASRGLDEAAGRGLGRLARLQVLLQLDQLLHAVVHLRHGLDLRQPQASLVGDVHPALTLRVLAVDTCT